eukprot:scaffold47449_cov110-Phaeocystis_antarctica.AAC.10
MLKGCSRITEPPLGDTQGFRFNVKHIFSESASLPSGGHVKSLALRLEGHKVCCKPGSDRLYGFNPFPAPEELIFRIWPSSLSVLARNPIRFGHFQPFLCGFLDCIPESRDPTVPHLACSSRFARAAP